MRIPGAAMSPRDYTAALRESTLRLARRAGDSIRDEYKLTFEDFGCRLVSVQPNVFVADFPSRNRQHWLAARLNRDHGGTYLVLNLSGQSYDTWELQGPVLDVVMSGGGPGHVPPLDVLLRLCVSTHKWLASSGQHVLVVNGADARSAGGAYGPVIVFLACYLSWAGLAANPKEGCSVVCEAIGVPEESVWASQRRYIKYFELLQHGLTQTVSTPSVVLKCVVLNGVGGDDACRVLEVWQQEQVLFRRECDAPGMEGVIFAVGTQCKGDVSIRVLRRVAGTREETTLEPELQVCVHTAFIADDFAHIPGHEVDALGEGVPGACSVDVFFAAAAAQEPESWREADAAAAVAAAAMEGAGCLEEADDASSGDPTPKPPSGQAGKVVFLPEDVDSFFDDL